jgi:hypothetical protein
MSSINELKAQERALNNFIQKLSIEIKEKRLTQFKKKKELAEILIKLEQSKNNQSIDIELTDHAIVRYLERFYKLNIDNVRKEILTPEIIEMTQKMGGNYKFTLNEVDFIIKDYKLVTIIK